MIPKIIHYCWFGGKPLPKSAQKCIASWKKYCPDYEIKQWNEDNFDINMNGYTKMCYREKKFAFLSDYARLVIICNEGGIYFDTDVEVIKNIDFLLDKKAFFGFENDEFFNTGQGFGAEKNSDVMLLLLREYDFLLNGDSGERACPELNTNALSEM